MFSATFIKSQKLNQLIFVIMPRPLNGSIDSIDTTYVQAYTSGMEHAFQQKVSILEPYFEKESQAEEFKYYDRIGEADEMQEDTTRYGDNPISEIEFGRRRSQLKDYKQGKYVDEKDLLRVLTDPMMPINQALLASANRKKDDIIIDNYFGVSNTGKGGETPIAFANGATTTGNTVWLGQKSNGSSNPVTSTGGRYNLVQGNFEGFTVSSQYKLGATAADTGLTIDKLKAARSTMLRLEAITPDETINCFMTHRQLEDLLGEEEIINADYAVKRSLAEGNVTTYMGYRFILTERLPLIEDERRVMVCTPRALKMIVGLDTRANTWRDTGKQNIPYIHFKLNATALRMWGEVAGEIRCIEA